MSLNLFLVILAGLVLISLLFLVYFLKNTFKNTSDQIEELKKAQTENKSLELMQQQIGHLTKSVNQQLQNMSGQFRETTGHIGSTLGDVKKDLGKMESVTKEVLDKAKSISNLENLLHAPKFRGGLGELFLGDLLAQILPPAHYTMQYKFKSGEIVDAIVKIGSNIVPIDAKFPLENFKKYLNEEDEKLKKDIQKKFVSDVKKHIQTIADKYILVIPVSPNSFFAYLQVIVLGLKGLQIEKSAKTIFQSLSRLQGDLTRFKDDFNLIGTHLGNARTKYDHAEKRLEKFTGKLDQIGGEESKELPD